MQLSKRPPPPYKTKKTGRGRRKLQHLCLDKGYNSEPEEQELIKQGYVLHIPPKRKRDEKEKKQETKIYNTTLLKSEKSLCKKMGCRENQLVAQQIQETVHQV